MNKKIIAIAALMLLASAAKQAVSQEKNEECIRNHSLYKSLLDVEAYTYAEELFKVLFYNYPKYSKQMYIDGVKIYKGLYASATTTELANAYTDTIKAIYMQRIEYFGDSANVYGRCGLDIMKLRKSDTAYLEAFNLLDKSVKMSNYNPDISVASAHLQLATNLAASKKIDLERFYYSAVPLLNSIYTNVLSGEKDASYSKNAESIFTSVKKSSAKLNSKLLAETVDKLTPQEVIDSHADIICKTLGTLNCDNSDTYAKASEKLYAINPTAEAAAAIARYYKRKQDWEKTSQYFKEAAEKETDNYKQADYYYELASSSSQRKRYAEAVSYAKKSAELNESSGKAYLLIAAIYGANAPSLANDVFERGKIYWVAADYALKANRADYNLKDEAESLINKYAHQFPTKEEAFMHSIQGGQKVEVEILKNKESTSARF